MDQMNELRGNMGILGMKKRYISSRPKLIHHSFRIEEDILSTIQEEAREKGLSDSSMVNQILKNYVIRDRCLRRIGGVLVMKELLRISFDLADADNLSIMSKQLGSTVGRSYVSYFFEEINEYTIIQFLKLFLSGFASFESKSTNNSHVFAVNHDINQKFSISTMEFIKGLVEPMYYSVKLFDAATGILSFSVERN